MKRFEQFLREGAPVADPVIEEGAKAPKFGKDWAAHAVHLDLAHHKEHAARHEKLAESNWKKAEVAAKRGDKATAVAYDKKAGNHNKWFEAHLDMVDYLKPNKMPPKNMLKDIE